ncbi:MAG: two-component sensor histidine kinase [Betaproteobacteria bacterium]|nr:two-component sensor histidine kinase [Betaproteobacteria bacterium]
MDGRQGAVRPSLQHRLSLGLSLAILVVASAAGVVAFLTAFNDANELQDEQLRQIAALMDRHRLPGVETRLPLQPGGDADAETQVVVERLDVPRPDGNGFPANMPDGLQTVRVRGEPWRAFVRTLDATGQRIAVAQRTAVRDEVASDAALRTVMPLLILAPILLLLARWLLRRTFAPLARLAGELDQRGDEHPQPVHDALVPQEVLPFVQAINRLLGRVGQAVAAQRRFVADAAHELRTPLTALSLQTERLAAADMSAEAAERLAVVRSGLQRTQQLVQQLLTMARMQQADAGSAPPVLLRHVVQRVIEDIVPLAEARQIDLGVAGELHGAVAADETALLVLVKNLVDNAVRYTPPGGRVDVSVQAEPDGALALQVRDTGPGIAPDERARVFDAFYRGLGNGVEGSGLGLAIVAAIAQPLCAQVELADAGGPPAAPGLCVTVRFPATLSSAL